MFGSRSGRSDYTPADDDHPFASHVCRGPHRRGLQSQPGAAGGGAGTDQRGRSGCPSPARVSCPAPGTAPIRRPPAAGIASPFRRSSGSGPDGVRRCSTSSRPARPTRSGPPGPGTSRPAAAGTADRHTSSSASRRRPSWPRCRPCASAAAAAWSLRTCRCADRRNSPPPAARRTSPDSSKPTNFAGRLWPEMPTKRHLPACFCFSSQVNTPSGFHARCPPCVADVVEVDQVHTVRLEHFQRVAEALLGVGDRVGHHLGRQEDLLPALAQAQAHALLAALVGRGRVDRVDPQVDGRVDAVRHVLGRVRLGETARGRAEGQGRDSTPVRPARAAAVRRSPRRRPRPSRSKSARKCRPPLRSDTRTLVGTCAMRRWSWVAPGDRFDDILGTASCHGKLRESLRGQVV